MPLGASVGWFLLLMMMRRSSLRMLILLFGKTVKTIKSGR
jgi:hypothetical protein